MSCSNVVASRSRSVATATAPIRRPKQNTIPPTSLVDILLLHRTRTERYDSALAKIRGWDEHRRRAPLNPPATKEATLDLAALLPAIQYADEAACQTRTAAVSPGRLDLSAAGPAEAALEPLRVALALHVPPQYPVPRPAPSLGFMLDQLLVEAIVENGPTTSRRREAFAPSRSKRCPSTAGAPTPPPAPATTKTAKKKIKRKARPMLSIDLKAARAVVVNVVVGSDKGSTVGRNIAAPTAAKSSIVLSTLDRAVVAALRPMLSPIIDSIGEDSATSTPRSPATPKSC